MALAGRLQRWSGAALRHIPAGSPYDVLDFRYAGRGPTIVGMNQASPHCIPLGTRAW
jgi:hypothetical protein